MTYLISVDDTDDITKETSTGEIAGLIENKLKASGAVIYEGISRHQLLLSDEIKYTSHNSSMCFECAVNGLSTEDIVNLCEKTIIENKAAASDPGLAVCCTDDLSEPERLIRFGFNAKEKVLKKEDAFSLAAEYPCIVLKELGGTGCGVIGALAGIGLRLSKSDGSMRGKCCAALAGRTVRAKELAGKCLVKEIITTKGETLPADAEVYIEDFVKLMYFDGRLCCMVSATGNGTYKAISRHQERETVIKADGTPVCEGFVPDNDKEEFYFMNGARSCFNCLYRRWTKDGFKCMNTDNKAVRLPKRAGYAKGENGRGGNKFSGKIINRNDSENLKSQKNGSEGMSRHAGNSKEGNVHAGNIYDVVIIGSGIIGAMTAYRLSAYRLKILVIDREYDIGEGETKANSGVLYPGIHPRGGCLKGISCVKGNAMYDEICEDLDIPMKRVGSLYAAFGSNGLEKLEEKYRRGLENGVPGMRILSGDEARKMEPGLSKDVIKAIYNPTTAVISPFLLITSLCEAAAVNGVEFRFGCAAEGIIKGDEQRPHKIITVSGNIKARFIVNAAGGGASLIESFVRPQDLVIMPRRGQFYVFDKQDGHTLSHVIYQAAENDEGGTLIAPSISGNIIAGPSSEDVKDYTDTETTREGLDHIESVAKKILPELDMGKVIANFAGNRTNISNLDKKQKDFIIRKSTERFISVLGIKNPGMTAAPYLAKLIEDELKNNGLNLTGKEGYIKNYKRQRPFLKLDKDEQESLISRDKRYGHIICRCEQITEGDIINVLKSPLPPNSLNGLKKRLRVGMGRCQGGFCTSRIIEIICREMDCAPEDILKSTDGSSLVKGRVK